MARWRSRVGSLTKAAFLSARNDAIANVAIIAAGFVTVAWRSVWPDVIAGLAIGAMNVDAARAVWMASHEEHAGKNAQP
jgi:Co/Zn/Cd efflux system component